MSASWTFERFDPGEEAGVVDAPHNLYLVCDLSGRDRGVSIRIGEICSISFGFGLEVAMFGGVVEGSDGAGETLFSCICFDIDVYKVLGRLCSLC
jgi:hypothetical protein